MSPVRVGGVDEGAGGGRVVWSLAAGRRGRRWRSVTTRPDGAIDEVLLLEVDTDGRPSRLELATAAGLLTLHPEPDLGEIHGNVVTPGGVRPLAFDWSPDHGLAVTGSAVPILVTLARLAGTVGAGEEREVAVLAIDRALEVRPATLRVARLADVSWRVIGPGATEESVLALDPDGLPVAVPVGEALRAGARWPLEDD